MTDQDKRYIEAAKKVGVHDYMLSYVENKQDIEDVLALDPHANIVAKIESHGGLNFIRKEYPSLKDRVNLMAARGDLFVEVGRPHKILETTRRIVEADKDAIAASRIFTSLRNSYSPACQDLSDIGFLKEIGYQHLMIGDDICFKEDSIMSALNLLHAIDASYHPRERVYVRDMPQPDTASFKELGKGVRI